MSLQSNDMQGGQGSARQVSLALTLFLFWCVLSGMFTPFLLAAGLGCALLVTGLARRMTVVDTEGHPTQFIAATVRYWPWLILEILKSGWTVTRIILSPSLPISPTWVRFRPLQRTSTGLVTHANSITLTPGTLTVQAEDEEFLVHALTTDGARACVASEMDRRIARLEGMAP